MNVPNPTGGRLIYTVEEAAALLSLSRAQVYRLLDSLDLGSVKIGKCRRITKEQLETYVRNLELSHGFVRRRP